MPKLLKFFFYLIAGYLFIVLAVFLWSLAISNFSGLRSVVHKVSKPIVVFTFSENSHRFSQNLSNDGVELKRDPRFSAKKPKNTHDFDHVVFLLSGFPSVTEHQIIQEMGIDVGDLAQTKPQEVIMTTKSSIFVEWSIIPLGVRQQSFVFADLDFLLEYFRLDCIPQLIHDLGALEVNFERDSACKK